MRGPPDPEMRSPAAANGRASRRGKSRKPEENSDTLSDLQAEKLRRLYSFCQATACTVASLAFAVSR
jgi:hypothetical protein